MIVPALFTVPVAPDKETAVELLPVAEVPVARIVPLLTTVPAPLLILMPFWAPVIRPAVAPLVTLPPALRLMLVPAVPVAWIVPLLTTVPALPDTLTARKLPWINAVEPVVPLVMVPPDCNWMPM